MSESGYVEIDGGELFYVSDGDGPPLVFAHGAPFVDHRVWNAQVELRDHFTVIRYDLRGFGRSTVPDGPYRHCDDLAALVRGLGYSSAHLAGGSFGASVVVDTALAHPALVDSLILVATVPLPGWQWIEGLPVAPALRLIRTETVETVKAAFFDLPMMDAARGQPSVVEALRVMSDDSHAWHLANRDSAAWAADDAADRLSEISAPTLVVVGGRDVLDVRMIGERLAADIPRATSAVLTEAGHNPNLEDPDTFNRLLRGFLNDL